MFRFPAAQNAIPEDFISNSEGFRPGKTVKPSGISKQYLDNGIGSYAVLPPAETWATGVWYVMLTVDQQSSLETTVTAKDSWNTFCVTGDGTPGDFALRLYVLPDEVAEDVDPPHPLLWPEKLKQHRPWTGNGSSGYTGFGYHSPSTIAKPSTPKTTAPPLPAGIRFRCVGCGHWFKQDGLAAHNTHCCPGQNDGTADWAILCECCLTLDEVSACKPGFPRPKPVKEVVQEKESAEPTTEATAEVVQ